jgi:hypothetical protein
MSISVNSNSAVPSALVEDGQAFYDSKLNTILEPDHSGEFVAIEPSSARYFLGQTATAALVAARNAMPENQFYLTHIGRDFAHKLGCHDRAIHTRSVCNPLISSYP